MKMENKTKRIYIRLTPTRHQEIVRRAQGFQGITHYINSAIDEFSDDTYKIKRDTRRQLIEFYKTANMQLGHIGGNLNQALHHINAMSQAGVNIETTFSQEIMPIIANLSDILHKLQADLRLIHEKALNLR